MNTLDAYEFDEYHQDFGEAFNDGYLLAEHNPEFLENVLFEIKDTDRERYKGLQWGKWQYENDKNIQHIKEFKSLRDKGKDKERDFDRDL